MAYGKKGHFVLWSVATAACLLWLGVTVAQARKRKLPPAVWQAIDKAFPTAQIRVVCVA